MNGKRVTEKEIQHIETLLSKDMSVASIADMLGLSQSTVNRVRTGTQCLQRKTAETANAVTTESEPTLFDITPAEETVQEINKVHTEKTANLKKTPSDRVYEKLLEVAHANKQLGDVITEIAHANSQLCDKITEAAQAYNRLTDVLNELVDAEYGI